MGYITLDRSLTAIQSVSAVSFGAFLLLHVPASAASALGESQATQLMLIGRELYQSDYLEPLFLGSAVIHLSSGLLRRLHRHGWKSFRSLSLHALSGYMLVPLVSFHVFLHRWLPLKMDIANDISYSFTSLFLQQYPALAWTHYSLISSQSIYSFSSLLLMCLRRSGIATCYRRTPFAPVRQKKTSTSTEQEYTSLSRILGCVGRYFGVRACEVESERYRRVCQGQVRARD